MSDHPTCKWEGGSGEYYTYYVWKLPANFDSGQDGNYIFAKKNSEGLWVPIYIGQGDLRERAKNHHKAECIKRKGATHIHVHLNKVEENRLSEESDLLKVYSNAYSPYGCNEKIGG